MYRECSLMREKRGKRLLMFLQGNYWAAYCWRFLKVISCLAYTDDTRFDD